MITFQLSKETEDGTLLEKIAVYNRANKEVHLFYYARNNYLWVLSLILTLDCPSPITRLP
jgi:hypothetical protein